MYSMDTCTVQKGLLLALGFMRCYCGSSTNCVIAFARLMDGPFKNARTFAPKYHVVSLFVHRCCVGACIVGQLLRTN